MSSHLVPDPPPDATLYPKRCAECGQTADHWRARVDLNDELGRGGDRVPVEVREICSECGASTRRA